MHQISKNNFSPIGEGVAVAQFTEKYYTAVRQPPPTGSVFSTVQVLR